MGASGDPRPAGHADAGALSPPTRHAIYDGRGTRVCAYRRRDDAIEHVFRWGHQMVTKKAGPAVSEGVFRGCARADASSQLSFVYPRGVEQIA